MTDDPVEQALAELQDLVRCRCHPAYTGRGLHDPDCECDSAEAVKIVTDRIEAQAAEIERLAKDNRWIIDERDRTFALMLSRAEEAEAEIERLRGALKKAVTSLQYIATNKISDELSVVEWDTHDTFSILDGCILSARTTLAELKGVKDD